MLNEKKRILSKLANPEERESKLLLLLSLPPDSPKKEASSGTIVIMRANINEDEERA